MTSWIAQNRADVLAAVGRLREALTDAEEALGEARLLDELGRVEGCLGERAWVRLLSGDREGSRGDVAEGQALGVQPEPQSVVYRAMFEALFRWPDDRAEATRAMVAAIATSDAAPASLLDTAPVAIRMAFRAGDVAALTEALAAFMRVSERSMGPVRQLERRWLSALVRDPSDALPELVQVAEAFEAIDYPLPAANAWADAALLAERLERAEEVRAFAAKAQALYAACSAVPLLGDVPAGVAPPAAAAVDEVAATSVSG